MLNLTTSEYLELSQQEIGVCLFCCELQVNVPFDTCNAECGNCGQYQVMGLERAMVSNLIEVK
jgi:hypothetical protein